MEKLLPGSQRTSSCQITNYSVFLQDTKIVDTVDLMLQAGSLDVIMGPNGSGKSTLALSLMGHPAYTTTGSIRLIGKEIQDLPVHKRAQAGLFLSFQQPHEIPGVPLRAFLKAAYESLHEPIAPLALQERVYGYLDLLELDRSCYERNVHEGFSGGQKKKLEMLQLLLLKPKVAILDEIDSGLDVDALRVVAHALQTARQENPDLAILLITHYQRMLNHITPNRVHLMMHGKIVTSGDAQLAARIEQHGYDKVV